MRRSAGRHTTLHNTPVPGTPGRPWVAQTTRAQTHSQKGEICMSTSRKLTWLFGKNAQLRDDYLKLKRIWKQESGGKKF